MPFWNFAIITPKINHCKNNNLCGYEFTTVTSVYDKWRPGRVPGIPEPKSGHQTRDVRLQLGGGMSAS
jgi:hypothetical protein